jgi:GDP-4-dehydro-6-deoxy-D-mannose reductase
MIRAFITGISGFAGRHLAEHLSESHSHIHIAGCGRAATANKALDATYHQCDVIDADRLTEILKSERPNRIFHLAGSVDSGNPTGMARTNIEGTLALLQACRDSQLENVRVLLVGSAAGFGEMLEEETGLGHDRTARPNSLYGITRETALQCGITVARLWSLTVFMCRPFNLLGPGLGAQYVATSILKRMMEACEHGAQRIELADQDAVRDFVDIRDAARAFNAIIELGRSNVPYSIGSGVGITIRRLAETLAKELSSGIRIVPSESGITSERPIRSGIHRSVADISRLNADTGWKPQIALAESLRDMAAYYRDHSVHTTHQEGNRS